MKSIAVSARPTVQMADDESTASPRPRIGISACLLGEEVRWDGGEGIADGIDADGGLRVRTEAGGRVLSAGEVHLRR